MTGTAATTAVLASTATGTDGAGLIGFLIVAALFVVCWFLYRSLRTQLGRIDVTKNEAQQPPALSADHRDATPGASAVDGKLPPG